MSQLTTSTPEAPTTVDARSDTVRIEPHAETGPNAGARTGVLATYAQLTKARLSMLVLWTTAVGSVLAAEATGGFDGLRFVWTLVGTAMAAGAASTLNQLVEVRHDRSMRRTRSRPLPANEIDRGHATLVAFALLAGATIALGMVGPVPTALAMLTVVLYVGVYTPLKTRTTLNTFVGAICGALPPMIGWAAVTGGLEAGAWALGALLFVWQIPHFLALAWLYRADYERGGFRMLPYVDSEGRLTARIAFLTSLMLLPLGLTLTFLGLAGWVYAIGATLLAAGMIVLSARFLARRTDDRARRLFLASLLYLATLLMLVVLDRGPVVSEIVVGTIAS